MIINEQKALDLMNNIKDRSELLKETHIRAEWGNEKHRAIWRLARNSILQESIDELEAIRRLL